MASLLTQLHNRYHESGDQLAHDAETCIGELCAALRKIEDATVESGPTVRAEVYLIAREALRKCAEGI